MYLHAEFISNADKQSKLFEAALREKDSYGLKSWQLVQNWALNQPRSLPNLRMNNYGVTVEKPW